MAQGSSQSVGTEFDWSWTHDPVDWVPPAVDPGRASSARIYDYLLGGKDHFAVDRDAAERLVELCPDLPALAKANRAFMTRAVHCLAADLGIKQFIDLGSGIPTSPSVHSVAQQTFPQAHVAYVDSDPVVLAHNRALLATQPTLVTVQHDLRRADAVLNDPEVHKVIDFDQPVGLLCGSVLHFVALELAPEVLAQYERSMAPGSALVISVASSEGTPPAVIDRFESVLAQTSTPMTFRSFAQTEQLFEGFEVCEPGLTEAIVWRNPGGTSGSVHSLAGVGVKR